MGWRSSSRSGLPLAERRGEGGAGERKGFFVKTN